MKSWQKFINALELTNELEDVYHSMRKIFQREGWTQKDLERPPSIPQDLMRLHLQFQPKMKKIGDTLRDYGFDVELWEVNKYIMKKLSHIDDITPLRNPNPNGD